jgi:superoxide dismutase, Fe-Mn family
MARSANESDVNPLDRRQFLVRTGGALAAGLIIGGGAAAGEAAPEVFKLPPLPYPADALEPFIDKMTMEIHHGKHHAAYVANLNKALADHPDLHKKTVKELLEGLNTLPEAIRTAVRNQGGGHHNHSIFWPSMKAKGAGGGGEPEGKLADEIKASFGGFAQMKEKMTEAATKVFGSGWAWLVKKPEGKLEVLSMPNQDSPLSQGLQPLLGLDVWEHAYYLKYQNRRPEYIAAWWNVVNWEAVGKRLTSEEAHEKKKA